MHIGYWYWNRKVRFHYNFINVWYPIVFYDYDRLSCQSSALDSVIAAANTDVQIDDRRTASVDRSENVDESTTGSIDTDKLNGVTDL